MPSGFWETMRSREICQRYETPLAMHVFRRSLRSLEEKKNTGINTHRPSNSSSVVGLLAVSAVSVRMMKRFRKKVRRISDTEEGDKFAAVHEFGEQTFLFLRAHYTLVGNGSVPPRLRESFSMQILMDSANTFSGESTLNMYNST